MSEAMAGDDLQQCGEGDAEVGDHVGLAASETGEVGRGTGVLRSSSTADALENRAREIEEEAAAFVRKLQDVVVSYKPKV